jgi:hypothetical protein
MGMKYCWYALTVLLLVSALAWAQAKDAIDEPLYDFLCGFYQVIGRLPDSDQTYSGKVEIKLSGNHLEIVRRVEGRAVRGIGKIETATPDKIKVLRVRFRSGDKDYEATYLISSDLDNHGRLTGHVYLKDGRTKTPGLEALFIDPSAAKTPAKRNRT